MLVPFQGLPDRVNICGIGYSLCLENELRVWEHVDRFVGQKRCLLPTHGIASEEIRR